MVAAWRVRTGNPLSSGGGYPDPRDGHGRLARGRGRDDHRAGQRADRQRRDAHTGGRGRAARGLVRRGWLGGPRTAFSRALRPHRRAGGRAGREAGRRLRRGPPRGRGSVAAREGVRPDRGERRGGLRARGERHFPGWGARRLVVGGNRAQRGPAGARDHGDRAGPLHVHPRRGRSPLPRARRFAREMRGCAIAQPVYGEPAISTLGARDRGPSRARRSDRRLRGRAATLLGRGMARGTRIPPGVAGRDRSRTGDRRGRQRLGLSAGRAASRRSRSARIWTRCRTEAGWTAPSA